MSTWVNVFLFLCSTWLNFFCFFVLQQALTKVPTNVQHFADLGVYKHLKKKTHLTKDVLFPHLPGHAEGADPRKVWKINSLNKLLNLPTQTVLNCTILLSFALLLTYFLLLFACFCCQHNSFQLFHFSFFFFSQFFRQLKGTLCPAPWSTPLTPKNYIPNKVKNIEFL